nr:hypothetical protein [uncultured Actinoplanes sp.]
MRPIDMREFTAGVTWWRTKTDWPADFHNRDYPVMAAENPNGRFDAVWWANVQPRLTRWNAFRPAPRSVVAANVAAQADALAQAWKSSCEPHRDADISAPEVTWEAVRAFPDVVATLKPTRSPVFTSKLCHFLLPKVFPVIDGLAVGGLSFTYERYFNVVKGSWEATDPDTRKALIAEMTRLVEQLDRPLEPTFPLVTKIVELALIGRRHGEPGHDDSAAA